MGVHPAGDESLACRGITIRAAVGAGIVSANIHTGDAPASGALPSVFFRFNGRADHAFDFSFVDAGCVGNAEWFQVYGFRTGAKRQTKFFRYAGKTFGNGKYVLSLYTANAFDMPVLIRKTENTPRCLRVQGGTQFFKALQMILCRKVFIYEHRVVAPIHPVRSKLVAQPAENFHKAFFGREIAFNLAIIRRQCELKIVFVAHAVDCIQSAEQGKRILCPKYDAVHLVRRQAYAPQPLWISGVLDKRVSLLEPIHKPLGVEGRDIRAPACADNHLLTSFLRGDIDLALSRSVS